MDAHSLTQVRDHIQLRPLLKSVNNFLLFFLEHRPRQSRLKRHIAGT